MDYSIRDIDAALLDAAKRGDLNEAKRLISEEADVNAYDGSRGNSLYWAVKNNHSDIAKVLLDNGADFFAYDSSRKRHVLNKYEEVKAEHRKVSLHLAARLGDLKALEDLLKKEANVNAKNDKGQTPLHLTVEVCYVDIPNSDEVEDYWNQYFAAEKKCGYVKIVEALLRNEEINVNAQDNNKKTSLHYAAKNNNKEIVVALIKAGAYINAVDKDGNAPLHLAGAKEIGDLLQSVKEANDKLLEAAKSGNIDDVENLLNGEGKAQVNAIAKGGNTPLHLAAQNGHKDVVEFLLSKGAKVDAQSDDLSTPLHFAAKYGHKDVVEFLLSNEAKVDAQSDDLSTPLHFAAKSRYKDTEKIVKFLLDKEADVNAQNDERETPLHLILQKIDLDIDTDKFYTLLNKKGINVNLTDKNKETPLHFFLKKKAMEIPELDDLLKVESINVNLQNIDGKTPLHLVIEKNNWNTLPNVSWSREKMVDILIEMKANVNAVDKDKRTPLHWTAGYGRKEIVEALINAEANVNAQDKYGKTPLDLASIEEIKTLLLKPPKKIDDSIASKDNEVGQEEDTGQEGNVQPSLQEQKEESQELIAEEVSDVQIEDADNGHSIDIALTKNGVNPRSESSTSEEHPSSFFDNLLNIIMKPFSLIGSFFGGFFSWLFGSDEPSTESDQIIAPSNSGGEELKNYQEGDNNII
ncbi:ankyrin repeat domain-containing protein [Wolbachia endosymbiont (group B) of Hofmannophila pseudospretella]|uniref:ankyrin repeat domain-containing protein n=1 Tax=Wolbachia endosymbiont (group B) of Hofmannophila pseudospretella TaxID=3066177 RepID=UPI003340DFC1